MYKKRTNVVHRSTEFTISDDHEVGHDHGQQNDENLHDCHKERSYHVQLWESMFSNSSDILNRIAGSTERMTVHDGSDIAIF